MKLVPIDELNAETPMAALATPTVPAGLFYLRSHSAPPEIDANSWRLAVRGSRRLELSLYELKTMGPVSDTITMECAGNGRSTMAPQPGGTPWDFGAASTTHYTGVPLPTVLGAAGVPSDTVEVRCDGADSAEVEPGRTEFYRRSLPVAAAMDPSVLIAWEMDGEPLTADHGAPARLVVPRWYGMASVKWLSGIETIEKHFDGYYQTTKYTYDGEPGLDGVQVSTMRVRSLIAAPGDGERVTAPVPIVGSAWSGCGAIALVEVSTDGGASWAAAELMAPASPHAATTWRLEWAPAVGDYEIIARATDAADNVQPLESVWNEHGYGNNVAHRVRVVVDP